MHQRKCLNYLLLRDILTLFFYNLCSKWIVDWNCRQRVSVQSIWMSIKFNQVFSPVKERHQNFLIKYNFLPVYGIDEYVPGPVEPLPHEHSSLRSVQVRYLDTVSASVRPVQLLTYPVYSQTRGALQATPYYHLHRKQEGGLAYEQSCFFLKKKYLENISPFCGVTDTPLFWTSRGVSSGFQSQSGQPYSRLAEGNCLLLTILWLFLSFTRSFIM